MTRGNVEPQSVTQADGKQSPKGTIEPVGVRRLEGKVAIVTGAASGIGAAIFHLFAAEGASQILVSLSEEAEAGEGLVRTYGRETSVFVGGDVSDPGTARHAVRCALDSFGRVDILVNNAGIDFSGIPLLESGIDECRRVFDVNFFGALLMLQESARAMLTRGGSIVNIVSRAAVVGIAEMGIYGASKGALLTLTKAAAVELAPAVRVNAVAPGPTDTGMMRTWINQQPDPASFERQIVSTVPQGRLATPNEIALAVLYLASAESSSVTGVVLPVDGGFTAQ
jgi:NAD(P)-dependent dehydrogenase (short-subunit alcohol dehydrogenase family)